MNKEQIIKDFEERIDLYHNLEEIAVMLVEAEMMRKHFFLMDIAHRVKTRSAVEGKLEKYRDRFKSITDITDLVGLRIICYFQDDVDRIAECLTELFNVVEIRDKRVKANISEFGYLSLHYICTLKDVEQYPESLRSIRFEIQIRTVLQHAWAQIEHDLGYKSHFGVSSPIRRKFSRMAGLLEIADEQFMDLRDSSKEYTEEIQKAIREDRGDQIVIDNVSLKEYMENSRFIEDFFNAFSEKINIAIFMDDIGIYLDQLVWLEVNTLGEFRELILRNQTEAEQMVCEKCEQEKYDFASATLFMQSVFKAELSRRRCTRAQLIRFFSLGKFDRKKAVQRAEEVLNRNGK